MYFESVFQELNGAYAPNTLAGYKKDLTRLCDWILMQNLDPKQISHTELIAYLETACKSLKMATVKRAVAAISTIYKYAELNDPTKHPKVELTLRRLARQRGSLQSQAKPLTHVLLSQLIALCDPMTSMGLRNQVLLLLGHETMRRRSELVGFRFDDLRQSAAGHIGLFLQHSKTDQSGHGRVVPISSQLAELLEAWHTRTGDGFILRGIRKGGDITESMTPESVNRILKRLESQLGREQQTLSGHSFRVGKTIDMIENGYTLEQIALAGGWNSTKTVFRYAQSWTHTR